MSKVQHALLNAKVQPNNPKCHQKSESAIYTSCWKPETLVVTSRAEDTDEAKRARYFKRIP
jgi:hypothetical protein